MTEINSKMTEKLGPNSYIWTEIFVQKKNKAKY